MLRTQLPLNALRAFEAAARHQNLTRAALELHVSQAALSHQIRQLEERLGLILFHRLPRGVALTEEGAALAPELSAAFDRISAALDRVEGGRFREALTVGVVGTFATGFLLPRLRDFAQAHPGIDLRVQTHNNRIEQAGDGMELAIRFGDGQWAGLEATELVAAPLSPACAPALAANLQHPRDLDGATLLRSFRQDEWSHWSAAAGIAALDARGHVFDSSLALADAAAAGVGVALLPLAMFERDLASGRLLRPFAAQVDVGRYWLTRLRSRPETAAMRAFRQWLVARCAGD
jgi:LysR family transcriptional regulator, regulator of gene expression of beta-lactamase